MSWQIGTPANAVVTVAHLAIAWAIITALVRTCQVRENLLGEQGSESRLGPGDLVRTKPATLEPH